MGPGALGYALAYVTQPIWRPIGSAIEKAGGFKAMDNAITGASRKVSGFVRDQCWGKAGKSHCAHHCKGEYDTPACHARLERMEKCLGEYHTEFCRERLKAKVIDKAAPGAEDHAARVERMEKCLGEYDIDNCRGYLEKNATAKLKAAKGRGGPKKATKSTKTAKAAKAAKGSGGAAKQKPLAAAAGPDQAGPSGADAGPDQTAGALQGAGPSAPPPSTFPSGKAGYYGGAARGPVAGLGAPPPPGYPGDGAGSYPMQALDSDTLACVEDDAQAAPEDGGTGFAEDGAPHEGYTSYRVEGYGEAEEAPAAGAESTEGYAFEAAADGGLALADGELGGLWLAGHEPSALC
eukprot:tig00001178_g7388.t1